MTSAVAPTCEAAASQTVAVDGARIVRFEGRALGSPLRLQVHGGHPAAADAAWALVGDEFARGRRGPLTAPGRQRADGPQPPRRSRQRPTARAAALRGHRRRPTGPDGSTEGRFDARVLADLERLGDHGADWATIDDPTERPTA